MNHQDRKSAQSDADQAKALLWAKAYALSQRLSDAGQFLARGWMSAWRVTPSENLELACLQLEDHGACDTHFLA